MNLRKSLLSIMLTLTAAPAFALPGDVVRDLPAPGSTCTGMTFDGKHIWVVDHGLDAFIAVDPVTGREIKRLKSPGYRPAGLAFDGSHLWNADVRDAQVYRVRPSDGMVTRNVPIASNLPWGQFPRSVAFDGKSLWVTDDKAKSIHQLDPDDGTTISEIPFPGKSVDAMTHDGRYLWVADRLADRLYAVHPPSGEVVVTLRSPGPHTSGLAWNGKELLALDYQTDRIYVVKRDDKAFLIREDPRDARVDFTLQVRNFGPDPLAQIDLFLPEPGDLPSQDIEGKAVFEPAPTEILVDKWSQRVLRFEHKNVRAGKVAEVRMRARVRAWSLNYVIYPDKVQSLWKIPAKLRRPYLEDAPKYDIGNPVIRKTVAEVVGDEKNPYWIARKIYRHLHDRMHYERVGGWDIAPKVLERGSGSCSEYTYVFISMCRAAGLPARYAGALVVRKDDASYDDVYHRWAEVYLPPYGWVPVDPSRGDKPTEAERADSFGQLKRDFLVTTHGGGGSEHLDWSYNHNERWTCRGRCRVELEGIAEWSPWEPKTPPTPEKP